MPARLSQLLSLGPAPHANLAPNPSFPTSPDIVFKQNGHVERQKFPGSAFDMIEKSPIKRQFSLRKENGGIKEDIKRNAEKERRSIRNVAMVWLKGRERSTSRGRYGRGDAERVRCVPELENYRPVVPRKDTPTKPSTATTTNVRMGEGKRGASISSVASNIVSQASTSLKRKPITVAPPLRLRDEFLAGENGKGKERVHDRHDSSFSSVSSSFEIKRDASRNSQRRSRVLSNPPIFTTEQLLDLRTLLKELDESLRQQDDLCQSFSRNLLYLLAVKEGGIKSNKRLNGEWKRGLCRELSVCREELGRVFTRKTGISERSKGVVRSLLHKLDELEKGGRDPEERRDYTMPPSTSVMNRKRGSFMSHLRERSLSRSRPPLTHAQHQYSTSLDSPPTPSAVLTRETITTSILSLRKDADLQRLLDECILDAVTRKCWKERWCRSVNMRIEMRRFVGFLGSRCDSMGTERAKMGVVLTTMEGVLGGRRSCDVAREVKEVRRFSWR